MRFCNPSRARPSVCLGLLCAAVCACGGARAQSDEQLIVDIRQGTDLDLALSPDRQTLVIDLLGGLWRLPISGGAATPLVAASEHAKHPQFSSDGRLIVYSRLIDGSWDVWALDTNSGDRWPVTNGPGHELEPTFANGRDEIAFAADRDGGFDIWSVDLHGGPWRLLVGGRGDARFPTFDAGGNLAYVERNGASWSLRVHGDGSVRELLVSGVPLAAPSWRPGGGVLVYQETDNAEFSRLRMIVLSQDRIVRSLTSDEDVFASRVAWIGPSEYLYTADGQIWRRQLAGRSRRPVHLFAAQGVTATPSPALDAPAGPGAPLDVHGIAGSSRASDGTVAFSALGDLWLAGNAELKPLTSGPSWDADPAIASDGRFVVYTSDRDGTTQIYRIETSRATEPQQLTSGPSRAYAPSLDASGTRLAYLTTDGASPAAPARLHLRDLEDGTDISTHGADMTSAERPVWVENETQPTRLLVAATINGARVRLGFDTALEIIERRPAGAAAPPAEPPTVVPQWRPSEPAKQRYVIQAGRLFDATGSAYRRHVDIHIEGSRIVAVVGRNLLPLPARVIDATDSTVIPGLIDAHVHDMPFETDALGAELLGSGITTVRMVASDVGTALAQAELWAAGVAPGPRMIVEAAAPMPPLDIPPSYPVPVLRSAGLRDDPGGTASPWDPIIANPQRPISPLHNLYQDVYALGPATRRAEVSSLAVLASERDGSRARALAGPVRLAATGPDRRALAARQAALLRLLRSGTPVVLGSEAPAVAPGLGLHLELELLHAGGVAADQALRTATIGGAIAIGIDQWVGTIEAGKVADLLVVAGDPLADLAMLREVQAVVARGQWLEPAGLQRR